MRWHCWLGGRKGIRPVKTEWWSAGTVICLERGADLHMAQLMSLPLTVSCFSKIQTGFTFLVPAHLGSHIQRAAKHVWVCDSKRQQVTTLMARASCKQHNTINKKLSYRRGTARCVVSIEILPIATQQCRNYLYNKSWPNRWYEVGDLVGGNAW